MSSTCVPCGEGRHRGITTVGLFDARTDTFSTVDVDAALSSDGMYWVRGRRRCKCDQGLE